MRISRELAIQDAVSAYVNAREQNIPNDALVAQLVLREHGYGESYADLEEVLDRASTESVYPLAENYHFAMGQE